MKAIFVSTLILLLGGIHIFSQGMEFGFHMVHQQLFFIPLVLTSFWFGMPTGLVAATVISMLYGPPMYLREHTGGMHFIVLSQICLYFFVAALTGYLSDRRQKQELKLLEGERLTALGKTATALSFEIDDISRSIGEIHKKGGGFQQGVANEYFLAELNRLQLLITMLKKFVPSFKKVSLSRDLNDILEHAFEKYGPEAQKLGLKLQLTPDTSGCPTMLSLESLAPVYDSLVSNALLFSQKGDTISLISKRQGNISELQVQDQGPGVAEANLDKLFSPFFTTRRDGYGLSISSGKKLLKGLGGDLTYRPGTPKGAVFTMVVPREGRSNNLEDYVSDVLSSPSHV